MGMTTCSKVFLQARVGVHRVGSVRGVVVAGDFQHSLTLVDVEADGALIDLLHLGEIDVENAAEIERIGKLVR